jgi:hypothetical protein
VINSYRAEAHDTTRTLPISLLPESNIAPCFPQRSYPYGNLTIPPPGPGRFVRVCQPPPLPLPLPLPLPPLDALVPVEGGA